MADDGGAGAALGCQGPNGQESLTNRGYSLFAPTSGSTRIVYVSASGGDDSNTGLSATTPKKTLAAGYSALRNGSPDWLMLKRGDTWTHESFPSISKSGPSTSAPMLIGSYGTSTVRPRILTGLADGLDIPYALPVNHIAVVGLRFEADLWHGDTGGPTGLNLSGRGADWLFEDCFIKGFQNNISTDDLAATNDSTARRTNLRVRRSILMNPLKSTPRTQSGNGNTNAYISFTDDLLFEDNYLINMKANDALTGGASNLSHNLYLPGSNGSGRVTLRGNVAYNGRSGLTSRTGGLVENNLIVRHGMALSFGSAESGHAWNDPGGNCGNGTLYSPGTARNNVILESRDHWWLENGTDPQKLGMGLIMEYLDAANVYGNIVANGTDGGYHYGAYQLSEGLKRLSFTQNIGYNWQQPTLASDDRVILVIGSVGMAGPIDAVGNDFFQPLRGRGIVGSSAATVKSANRCASAESSTSCSGWNDAGAGNTYPDPGRTVGRYNSDILGGPNDTESFMSGASLQSKFGWRIEYTAQAVNAYIRAGFGRVE